MASKSKVKINTRPSVAPANDEEWKRYLMRVIRALSERERGMPVSRASIERQIAKDEMPIGDARVDLYLNQLLKEQRVAVANGMYWVHGGPPRKLSLVGLLFAFLFLGCAVQHFTASLDAVAGAAGGPTATGGSAIAGAAGGPTATGGSAIAGAAGGPMATGGSAIAGAAGGPTATGGPAIAGAAGSLTEAGGAVVAGAAGGPTAAGGAVVAGAAGGPTAAGGAVVAGAAGSPTAAGGTTATRTTSIATDRYWPECLVAGCGVCSTLEVTEQGCGQFVSCFAIFACGPTTACATASNGTCQAVGAKGLRCKCLGGAI